MTGMHTVDGGVSLAMAAVLAQALLAPLDQFGGVFQALIDIRQSTRPVAALLQLEQQQAAAPTLTVGGGSANGLPRSEIRFRGAAFRYPGAERDVLNGLDLTIPAGSSVAIVGLTGAGKTTLIKLLCGFYDPTRGSIAVDGTDLRDLDRAGWQGQVAAIFQDFARFPFTAADNIRIGALGATDDQIRQAAAAAGADGLIADLPVGWQTPLSREITGGTDLSGGQWQRLALARAIRAADTGAGVLILDEPAANLDVRAEADLNERFFDLTSGRTTIVVSHRFSTVRQADRICVLEHGRIKSGSRGRKPTR